MSYLHDDINTIYNMSNIDETPNVIDEYLEKKINTEEDKISACEYIQQLNFYDKIALTLSIEILGSSFDLLKSNGYKEWICSFNKKKD